MVLNVDGGLLGRVESYVAAAHPESEFSALAHQQRQWSIERPLAGLRLLDATPVMRNTVAKYLPLLASGAELTVGVNTGLPFDPAVVEALTGLGVRVADTDRLDEPFDVIFDCAGACAGLASGLGYVELTRSGETKYADCPLPVFLTDSGRIKRIENELGTGDGFVRAMRHLGHGDFAGRDLLVFGAGKVGAGVATAAMQQGARVRFVDRADVASPVAGCERLDLAQPAKIDAAVAAAWCVVSATGQVGALAPFADSVNSSAALVANMGVEDEFGPRVPASRVLNGKAPLNFLLSEPTRLRYLDPTFALTNAGALELLNGTLNPGVNAPPALLEESILATWNPPAEAAR